MSEKEHACRVAYSELKGDDSQRQNACDTLAEVGFNAHNWDTEELADDEANWRRIVWIAAGNIQEDQHANQD